ncbi:MAG: D-alanyl-D-alanine carboxypeptidase [Clostridia bacterium]|nr:D-alanyl-D-alanine carboxypeptidase [Clostridia bacterium]
MKTKLFSLLLVILIVFSVPFTALADNEPADTSGAGGKMSAMVTTSGKAAMLVSLDTGDVLYQKNIDEKVYPASIAKIMTVTVCLESPKYDPTGTVEMTDAVTSYITGTGSAVSDLKIGETFTQLDLMYMILMKSSGDCAYLGALFYGDTVENFMTMMNDKAQKLGLSGTHYGNPVGLHDEQTYTTVRDIATLTKYALKNETFKTICGSASYQMPATNMSGERLLSSTNELLLSGSAQYYTYASGVKTGFTDEAGRCLVSTASYNDMNYLCIIMGCPNGRKEHFSDSAQMFRTAFSNFELRTVNMEWLGECAVNYSMDTDHVTVNIAGSKPVLLPCDSDNSTIEVRPHYNSPNEDGSFNAPIKKGDVLGKAELVYAGQVLDTVDLVAGADVSRSNILRIWSGIKEFFRKSMRVLLIVLVLVVLAALALTVAVVFMNRKRRRRVRYIPYNGEDDE